MKKTTEAQQKKAIRLETQGDKLAAKGKYRQALAKYQESEAVDSERLEIYQKLVETLNQFEGDWTEEDFSNSLAWTMRQQELEDPKMKRVHEKFTPEYEEVKKLAQRLMLAPHPDLEEDLIDKILSYEQKATLPILHFLLSLKSMVVESMADDSIPEEKNQKKTPKP